MLSRGGEEEEEEEVNEETRANVARAGGATIMHLCIR